MIQICWRTYRWAFAALLACSGSLVVAVATGYALAQADPVPPVSAVTPAPSGSGQLGRAPRAERTTPPTVRQAPTTSGPPREWRRPRPTSPAPPTTAVPSPTAGSPSASPADEGSPTPEVSPTP